MVDGVLYASNGVGLAEAFDPETGKTLWVQQPGVDGVRDVDAIRGSANRGVAYWGEGADARVITFRNRYLYALNPKTGRAHRDVRQERRRRPRRRRRSAQHAAIAGPRCR